MLLNELMEEESHKRKTNEMTNMLNANMKLVDELKWIKKDIQEEIYKIQYQNITKEQIINDLKFIIKNN